MESPLKLGLTSSSGTWERPSVHILRISESSSRIVTRPGENRYSCATGPMFEGVPLGRHRPLLLSGILSRPRSPRTAAIRSSRIAAYLGLRGTPKPNMPPAAEGPGGGPATVDFGGGGGGAGAHTPDQSGNCFSASQSTLGPPA